VRLPEPPLLLVTDRHQARRPLAAIAEMAFEAGCRWASVREKDLTVPEQIALLAEIRARARPWGARVSLHGDPNDARAAEADGVHLSAGGNVPAARALLGPAALIGLSIHSADEARVLDPALVDYVIAGPFHASASKPGHLPALGPEGLQAIVAVSPVPVIAIGGIDTAAAAAAILAGAAGIAVMGGIMRAMDPEAEIRALISALGPPDSQ
jgi:thiamine-phosphate pyrophosphorylase